MKTEDWKELNEKSHYYSLQKQNIEHRKLIRKLQNEVKSLKEALNLPVVVRQSEQLCDHDYSDGTGTGYNICRKCGDMY
jgi:hypothetical protein